MTTTAEQLEQWRGRKVVDVGGHDIGKLEDVYYTSGGEPVLARISSGLLGRHHSLVPLSESSVGRDYLRVGFHKDQIDRSGTAEIGEVIDRDAAASVSSAYGVQLPASENGYESAAQLEARRAEAALAADRAAALEAEANRLDHDAASTRAHATAVSASASDAETDAADARRAADAAQARAAEAAAAARLTP